MHGSKESFDAVLNGRSLVLVRVGSDAAAGCAPQHTTP